MNTFNAQYDNLINQALSEDLGWGDITSDILIPIDQRGTAIIKAKANGILAGTEIAKLVFLKVDPDLKLNLILNDGSKLSPDDTICKIEGRVASILKAERVALNFLQHLSGIATQTSRFLEVVKGLTVRIADTRKTIPGLRILEKQAVVSGGGINHRMNLADSILIKNNHIILCQKLGLSIKEIIFKVKEKNSFPAKQIEIEVNTVQQALEAAEAGADIIMLDNMRLDDLHKAVKSIKGRAIIEASGGVNLDNVRSIAETGVDIISVGALTHSAKALDISLLLY